MRPDSCRHTPEGDCNALVPEWQGFAGCAATLGQRGCFATVVLYTQAKLFDMAVLTEAQIFDCCACRALAAKLAAHLQADGDTSLDAVITACRDIWWNLVWSVLNNRVLKVLHVLQHAVAPPETPDAGLQTSVAGWLEAFGAHPRIGDATALKAKLGGFGQASRSEQAAASGAPEAVYQVHDAALSTRERKAARASCCQR